MKIAVNYITDKGQLSALKICDTLNNTKSFNLKGSGKLRKWVETNFHKYDGHVFIMSMGIVYRVINKLITDKYNDPAVVVVDDACRFSIAALSGHEGGANNLAFKIAQITGAEPVVTTASDTNRKITMGIGCRKGVLEQEIVDAVKTVLSEEDLKPEDIRIAATAEIKRDETGLIGAFDRLKMGLIFIPMGRIKTYSGYKNISKAAMNNFGIPGVSEPCALLSGRNSALIREKTVIGRVTIALAEEDRI